MPVYHPKRHGHVLLRPGATLNEAALGRLSEYKIAQLWIRYPALEFVMDYASPHVLEAKSRLKSTLSGSFDKLFDNAHAELDYKGFEAAVSAMIEKLLAEPKAAILVEELADAECPPLAHSTNVCFLSLLMGLKLDSYLIDQRRRISAHRAKNIENLGVGAMLHDIGMLQLPEDVRLHWERCPDDADPQWREHTKLGYEMVRGKVAPTAAAAVLHHHQNYDGSGFPTKKDYEGNEVGLDGQRIHIFSRIIAVADRFDTMRGISAGIPEDQAKPVVRVLRELRELARCRVIDPAVFKALIHVAPAFAPGTQVTLSDGRRCAVCGWDPLNPCQPTVTPMSALSAKQDEQDEPGRLSRELIELARQPHLHIAAVDGQDVSDDLFEPAFEGEFDLRLGTAATKVDEESGAIMPSLPQRNRGAA